MRSIESVLRSLTVGIHRRLGRSPTGGNTSPCNNFFHDGIVNRLPVLRNKQARCCGIVGYIGQNDKSAVDVILEGLEILQNRGYDSCGVATISPDHEIVQTKMASKGTTSDAIERLIRSAPARHRQHSTGVGHTRWATHGAKTDTNAHPHSDWKNRIALVHNGTIHNFQELKTELVQEGIPFKSETDTEVISNLIGNYLEEGRTFESACTAAVNRLQGTWGLAIIHHDLPDQMFLARNGSPLLVGGQDGEVYVVSEPAAMANHTNQCMPLEDGEMCLVSPSDGGISALITTSGRQMMDISCDKCMVSPAPFGTWTIREIHEQPQAMHRALGNGSRVHPVTNAVVLGGLDVDREKFVELSHLIISGCGTSLHAAMYGQALMEYLNTFDSVRCIDASEISEQNLPNNTNTDCNGLLLLSQSGETRDVMQAFEKGKKHNLKIFSIVNVVGSTLARMTQCGVYINAGREVAVASTKAFTSQIMVLALVALWFAQNKGSRSPQKIKELVEVVQRLPYMAGLTLHNVADQCKEIASRLEDQRSMFILGKGFGYPVALEGALKIKEISYSHAEGFAGGALKHGPFAMIDEAERTPVVMLILNDEHRDFMMNSAQQVKARGGHVIAITDCPNLCRETAGDIIAIPACGPLTALLAVIPLQLLAHALAEGRSINPDKPRGLAKTVTVS